MKNIVHILGASGSGTSTLGKALADKIEYKWLDTDDYFWIATDPPYEQVRPVEERIKLIEADIEKHPRCAISGSLCGWSDERLIPLFDLVVFIYTPTDIRIERIKKREYERSGERIYPEGDRHEKYAAFIEWAATYDDGDTSQRSLARHREWLKFIHCPVLHLDGTEPVDKLVEQVSCALS